MQFHCILCKQVWYCVIQAELYGSEKNVEINK